MRPARWVMACAFVLAVFALSACKQSNLQTVKTLLDDPSRFDKQTVSIVGTVEEAAGVMGYGVYRVNDGTGTLTVLTKTGGAPRSGASVGVEGEFRSAFTLGTETAAALMETKRFTPKE